MDTPPPRNPLGRLAMLLVLLVAAAVGGRWLLTRSQPRWVGYADGSKARVVEVFIGEHRAPTVGRPWSMLVGGLPDRGPFPRLKQWVGGVPMGNSRSWMHVPVYSNSLHLWLEAKGPSAPTGGSFHELEATIVDAEGWRWVNHGRSSTSTTLFGSRPVDLFGVEFAAFPRWQQDLGATLGKTGWSNEGQTFEHLGKHAFKNPRVVVQPVTNWPVAALPQTVIRDGLEARLDAIRFQPGWRARDQGQREGAIPPDPELTLLTAELDGTNRIAGVWHRVQVSYFDNFGNSSHGGLPPKRVGTNDVPPIQWRIAVKLVGDDRSRRAGNAFGSLAAWALPLPGTFTNIPVQRQLGTVSLTNLALFGPGRVTFVDGVLATNQPPNGSESAQVGESNSSSNGPGGTVSHSVELSSGRAFVVALLSGSTEGLWFSCRAANPVTGEAFWLQAYGQQQSRPTFQRVFNDRGLVWFSGPPLNTNAAWTFTVGIHQPREVEFFVDRPEYLPPD